MSFFVGGGSSIENIRGGYHIDSTDSRIQSKIIPIGLHRHGENGVFEEDPEEIPIDDFDMFYQEESPVLPEHIYSQMMYMVIIPKKSNKNSNTKKKKQRK